MQRPWGRGTWEEAKKKPLKWVIVAGERGASGPDGSGGDGEPHHPGLGCWFLWNICFLDNPSWEGPNPVERPHIDTPVNIKLSLHITTVQAPDPGSMKLPDDSCCQMPVISAHFGLSS